MITLAFVCGILLGLVLHMLYITDHIKDQSHKLEQILLKLRNK